MKKVSVFLLILILTPLIGGIYGIAHDQITFSISPEYYTKFKFYQFGLADSGDEAIFPSPRLYVSIVGFLATWWMGIPIGFILGLVGLKHADSKRMLKVTLRAILITVIIAFVTGLIGLGVGKFFLAHNGVHWNLPDNLVDTPNFIAVGSMHNFSYLGGLIGLIAGIVYSLKKRGKQGEWGDR